MLKIQELNCGYSRWIPFLINGETFTYHKERSSV